MTNKPIARFAPSPTGGLHLGSARTAIFNWLFARHTQGKFLLRIEDTDQKRSQEKFVDDIIQALDWLGISDYEDSIYYQMQHQAEHVQIAQQMVENKHAYRCYCTPEELALQRAENQKLGKAPKYNGTCRDLEHKNDTSRPHVIRLRRPKNQKITINDLIQGEITWDTKDLDDFILVRSDGTPTYMLSVVVDDHNMGITHVIRGNDHLSNTPKQYLIYRAMQWHIPHFAHIPLIHSKDNVKLSKRHGAVTVQEYEEQGFLPDALFNYLLRLGWSYGNEEIISREQAVQLFNINNVGKSAAKFDPVRLLGVNKHYMQQITPEAISKMVMPFWRKLYHEPWNPIEEKRLKYLMPELQIRSNTLLSLAQDANIIRTLAFMENISSKADKILRENLPGLRVIYKCFSEVSLEQWNQDHLKEIVETLSTAENLHKAKVAQAIRAALTGSHISPSIYDILYCLGQQESLTRIKNTIDHYK